MNLNPFDPSGLDMSRGDSGYIGGRMLETQLPGKRERENQYLDAVREAMEKVGIWTE